MQGEELNRYGALYVERYPKLNVKVVDGSSLAVAVLLNSIPRGTTQVVLRGKLTKVAYALAFNLCQRGIKVRLFCSSQHKRKVKLDFGSQAKSGLGYYHLFFGYVTVQWAFMLPLSYFESMVLFNVLYLCCTLHNRIN